MANCNVLEWNVTETNSCAYFNVTGEQISLYLVYFSLEATPLREVCPLKWDFFDISKSVLLYPSRVRYVQAAYYRFMAGPNFMVTMEAFPKGKLGLLFGSS